MASANREAIDREVILFVGLFSGSGIVLSMTSSLMDELSILSNAGPDSTPWVQQAYISLAPISISASAAFATVPAVSIRSSMRTTFLFLISPITFITSLTFAFGLLLSIMAIGMSSHSANFLVRV